MAWEAQYKWRQANKEKYQAYRRAWYEKNSKRINAKKRKRYKTDSKYRKKTLISVSSSNKRRRARIRAYQKEWNRHRRQVLLKLYGNCCRCCGTTLYEHLTFDHIRGRINGEGRGSQWYRKLSTTTRHPNIQILCWNCNASKGIYGRCPCQDRPTKSRRRARTSSHPEH